MGVALLLVISSSFSFFQTGGSVDPDRRPKWNGPLMIGPFETSIRETSHIRTELLEAWALRGKLLHRGGPVGDFEVLVWAVTGSSEPTASTVVRLALP